MNRQRRPGQVSVEALVPGGRPLGVPDRPAASLDQQASALHGHVQPPGADAQQTQAALGGGRKRQHLLARQEGHVLGRLVDDERGDLGVGDERVEEGLGRVVGRRGVELVFLVAAAAGGARLEHQPLGGKVEPQQAPEAAHGAGFANHGGEGLEAAAELEGEGGERGPRRGRGHDDGRRGRQLEGQGDEAARRLSDGGAAGGLEHGARQPGGVAGEEEDRLGARPRLHAPEEVGEQGIGARRRGREHRRDGGLLVRRRRQRGRNGGVDARVDARGGGGGLVGSAHGMSRCVSEVCEVLEVRGREVRDIGLLAGRSHGCRRRWAAAMRYLVGSSLGRAEFKYCCKTSARELAAAEWHK